MEEPEMQVGWDGRQVFIFQMGKRGDLVLDADYKDPNQWFERLQDFFDFIYPALKVPTDYEDKLEEIDKKLYSGKDGKGNTKTKATVSSDKLEAYKDMRKLFREIQKELWISNLYMPRYEKKDPSRAIMDMGD